MGLQQRLGQVSWNSMNIQYLAVLLDFIKASSFPFYTDLYLLSHLANLPHKCKGQDLRLVRVSWNSENIQNLAVLHGFSKASSFPLYTNFYLLLRFANLRHKCIGEDQRLGQVSLNSKNVQNLAVLHGFIKASSFPFYTDL